MNLKTKIENKSFRNVGYAGFVDSLEAKQRHKIYQFLCSFRDCGARNFYFYELLDMKDCLKSKQTNCNELILMAKKVGYYIRYYEIKNSNALNSWTILESFDDLDVVICSPKSSIDDRSSLIWDLIRIVRDAKQHVYIIHKDYRIGYAELMEG